MKPKYGVKAKLCYMTTDSCIVYWKTEGIYVDITKYFETRFDTSNYEILFMKDYYLEEKVKQITELMSEKLDEEIKAELACFYKKHVVR